MTQSLKIAVEEFLQSLVQEQRRAPLTADNYQRYLKRFINWLNTRLERAVSINDITVSAIAGFRQWLGRQRGRDGHELASSTQNYHLIALRSFLKHLHRRQTGNLPPQAVKLMRPTEHQLTTMAGTELERLLAAPGRTQETELIKLRDRALLELMVGSGLKVSELVSLQRDQVLLDHAEFNLRGHHGRVRTVPLSHQTRHHLKRYLEVRTDHSPALFVRHDRAGSPKQAAKPLTSRSVQRSVERYRRLANLQKKITPSSLRHAYAAYLVAAGTDLKTVQTLLGHRHASTTATYARSVLRAAPRLPSQREEHH